MEVVVVVVVEVKIAVLVVEDVTVVVVGVVTVAVRVEVTVVVGPVTVLVTVVVGNEPQQTTKLAVAYSPVFPLDRSPQQTTTVYSPDSDVSPTVPAETPPSPPAPPSVQTDSIALSDVVYLLFTSSQDCELVPEHPWRKNPPEEESDPAAPYGIVQLAVVPSPIIIGALQPESSTSHE